ncbi:uncharacterized protein DNG_04812 [Cephalotrichum gorgonifer]|uniref:DUF3835 domain-containing protein n=1 Tax=Cephalotrichum gorgonifer TaxID=2041049 RepID=A0AAE8MYT7_9PEZI|nr:uncharacterized protein DNG_04812 [Cephalotrichum gorgonifer]
MASSEDGFSDLERNILQLEANVKELRAALEHWRRWDAEYEALKEEVEAASRHGPRETSELLRIREGFEGDLVSGKELAEIFGAAKGQRSASQVIGVLERRLDYVGTNIRTLERKVEKAESEVDAAREAEDLDAMDEDGLPITEIEERLDEEGNIISHKLWTPGTEEAKLEGILEKSGIAKGSQEAKGDSAAIKSGTERIQTASAPPALDAEDKQDGPAPKTKLVRGKPTATDRGDISASSRPADEKKVITQVGEDELPEPSEQPMSRAAKRVQHIMDTAREQEENKEAPVIPLDESAEDAALRQEMLSYSMNSTPDGMGQVVAVMNDLRFENSDDDDDFNTFSDDDDDDEDEDEETDGEEGEDKWGRTTSRVVSDAYKERMLDLEQRLGVQSRFTRKLAEEAASAEDDETHGGIGKIVINPGSETAEGDTSEKRPAQAAEQPSGVLKSADSTKTKKSVRFASELDIAPTKAESEPKPKRRVTELPATENPVLDLIVEQTGQTTAPPPAAPKSSVRKPSRFKKMKEANPEPSAPAEEEGKKAEEDKPSSEVPEIVQSLSWTETKPEKITSAGLDGDFDEVITKRALADEYHKQRRRMIAKEGGFMKEDMMEVEPLDEEPRRISKFRAARLSRQ